MGLVMIFDMRSPDFGAPREELYAAALELGEQADRMGFDVISFGEHHGAQDGYNPSPLILSAAMAARTKTAALRTSVLLAPCYDAVRLAEDAAITQIVSAGRLQMGVGFGYRPSELAMYGHSVAARFETTMQTVDLLRKAWTGEAFEYNGRPGQIAPVPTQPIPVLLGGVAPKVARAAAQEADGFLVPLFPPKVWDVFRSERLRLNKPDPGDYPQQGPTFLWVSEDPAADWHWIEPHVMHVLDSYSQWTAQAYGKPAGPYAGGMTPEKIRQSSAYQVLTPSDTVALVEALGDHSSLYLTPLFGGIDPVRAQNMLKLFEQEVLPHVPRGKLPRWGLPAIAP